MCLTRVTKRYESGKYPTRIGYKIMVVDKKTGEYYGLYQIYNYNKNGLNEEKSHKYSVLFTDFHIPYKKGFHAIRYYKDVIKYLRKSYLRDSVEPNIYPIIVKIKGKVSCEGIQNYGFDNCDSYIFENFKIIKEM